MLAGELTHSQLNDNSLTPPGLDRRICRKVEREKIIDLLALYQNKRNKHGTVSIRSSDTSNSSY